MGLWKNTISMARSIQLKESLENRKFVFHSFNLKYLLNVYWVPGSGLQLEVKKKSFLPLWN